MILRIFLQLIKKNFKVLIRSKASALIVIFGPLLVILLLGLAFDNTNAYALNIGVYADSYTETITSFIEKMSEKQFNVVRVNTEADCTQRIKEGALHTCIVFPKDFSIQGENRKNEITFYVDYSRINMVYLILDTLSSRISMRSKEISLELTNKLLSSLESTRVEIFNKKPLLSQLSAWISESTTNSGTVTTELGSLDLAVNLGDFKIQEIKSQIAASNGTTAISKIDSARSKVNTAKGLAAGLEGGAEVVSTLNSAISSLSAAEEAIINDQNASSETLRLVELSYNQIILAKEKLDKASAAKSKSTPLLAAIKSNLDQSAAAITDIKASFDKIDGYIGSIQVSGADEVVSPIKTNIKAVSTETTHLNQLFPSLIILVIMFVSLLLSTTLVMLEKHSPAYFRNFITPVNDFWFVISTYFTNMVLVLLQIIIIIAISVAFFSADLWSAALEAAIALVLITSAFTFMGMLIGYLFNSEESATLASISTGSLFLLLSNLIIPLESVPAALREVLVYNPFVVSESLLRKAIIYFQPLKELQFQVYYLLILSLSLFAIVMLINLIGRRNLLRGLGKLSPGRTSLSIVPGFLKYKKPSKEEELKLKEEEEKKKEFSLQKVEQAKKKAKPGAEEAHSGGLFGYLK